MKTEVVGILALQGAYQKHADMLSALGVENRLVRFAHELEDCAALILPGGESTTMSLLMQKFSLYDALRDFAATHPVMGVCAGAILMADSVNDARVKSLGIMPVSIERNHYGRQVHSFSAELMLQCDADGPAYTAHFIRAPSLLPTNDRVEVLARYNGDAVMLRMQQHMALSFHPELTDDSRVHACWLNGFHSLYKRS